MTEKSRINAALYYLGIAAIIAVGFLAGCGTSDNLVAPKETLHVKNVRSTRHVNDFIARRDSVGGGTVID